MCSLERFDDELGDEGVDTPMKSTTLLFSCLLLMPSVVAAQNRPGGDTKHLGALRTPQRSNPYGNLFEPKRLPTVADEPLGDEQCRRKGARSAQGGGQIARVQPDRDTLFTIQMIVPDCKKP